jgi:DNA-binding NarL/FixJ family response regulator
LLSGRPERVAAVPVAGRNGRLTSRQMMVLSHLQQGKANKIIAHELNMSESTVKVHVRNIMRKMGATNRTEAAYKAQSISKNIEYTDSKDL